MNPQGLINRMENLVSQLGKKNEEQKQLGREKAEAEQSYRVAKAKEILRLKAEKYPVTLIADLTKGNEKVAELKLKSDIAESAYFTAISATENIRLEIEIIRSQLTWLRSEMNNQ
ncbi:hypothetical protein [Inconstantimicrobium mannanitabidum]|uniref:Uncharacterized protein n=1 Tax=Inconstantimicrobium mannanitabidum TaxID=1604901 RepID=A0ACB5R9A8_9CLOT|nr:hypothetical protein [Clostridium sp. TW13]GKX65621.1 hypothetical protein rsdtw13_08790 [Clostridium sp. TW13]